MSRIRIKHFGPIKEGCLENDGWIDISKVTVFIGNQGSGKSTVAKLISMFTWIEKALVRGDFDIEWLEVVHRLDSDFLPYHRLEFYIDRRIYDVNTYVDYQGDAYNICYSNHKLQVTKIEQGQYSLPQIMYVPAERNFISYVKSAKELKLSSDSLQEFLTEFNRAKGSLIIDDCNLPINNVTLEYNMVTKGITVIGNNYRIDLSEASSGFQSIVPVYLVSKFLSESLKAHSDVANKMNTEEESRFRKELEEILSNEDLTSDQRRIAISVLSSKFNKTAFINIVEEPEQNLYPSSQWALLKSLLEFNNMSRGNKLVMTTHSPYIVNYLSIAIEAGLVLQKVSDNQTLLDKLFSIVPEKSILISSDVSIYEMDENTGTIKKLSTYEGIPSDRNMLNEALAEGNELFDQLLEIEQEIGA